MPPNSIEKTLTIASPPRTAPTAAEAKRTSRMAMPPCSISSPAKMKNGIASSEKTLMPEMIRWKVISSGKPSYQKAASADMPRAKATGMPMTTHEGEDAQKNRKSHGLPPLFDGVCSVIERPSGGARRWPREKTRIRPPAIVSGRER